MTFANRILMATLVVMPSSICFAQPLKTVPLSHISVDVVTLKSGKSLRGGIVFADGMGPLTMAVSARVARSLQCRVAGQGVDCRIR